MNQGGCCCHAAQCSAPSVDAHRVLVLGFLCLELQNGQPNMMHAVLQVDVLKLTVERLGSASKGLCSGAYRNLESLTVTHIMREDDVQVRSAGSRARAACWTKAVLALLWPGGLMGLPANLVKSLP